MSESVSQSAHSDYWELGLSDYLLEDSYVEQIRFNGTQLAFKLLLVLRETHPDYSAPEPAEQYCYAGGYLSFRDVKAADWLELNITPTVDLDGSVDFGNIDELYLQGGCYHISGSWGKVRLNSSAPTIELAC